MWIDTHAHLVSEQFRDDVDEVVKRAKEAGVGQVVCVADTAASARGCVALARRHRGVWATVGIHPHHAAEATEADFADLRRLLEGEARAAGGPVVAVGEAGLDFHYDFSPRHVQEDVFRKQIRLAHEFGLPIIMHSRKAEERVLDVLAEEGVPEAGGVLHCFWGSAEVAESALAMGLYLGVGGPVTFKNADDLRSVLKSVPTERLLVETDAPYLAPVPFRGKRNEPAYVVHAGRALAELLGVVESELAAVTSRNAARLFGIDAGE